MTGSADAGGRPSPGRSVRIVTTKWGDRPHWEFAGRYLGADEHGDWVGFPAGTAFHRPGADFVSPVDQVTVLPRLAGWVATFHASGGPVRVYVDVTTPPAWSGSTVRVVDLDLDVIELPDGRVLVDDEDEFAEHQVAYGYPADVVEQAQASCDAVLAEVRAGRAPYDGTAQRWLDLLSDLSRPTTS